MYWVMWSFSAETFSVRPGEGREGREMGRSLWEKDTAEVFLGLVYCFFDHDFAVLRGVDSADHCNFSGGWGKAGTVVRDTSG